MTGCVLWTGAVHPAGYGRLTVNGRQMLAHRSAYTEKHGPIPAGMFVCHRCDVRLCVNPDHLFLGTHKENMADMKAKGRARNVPRRGEDHHGAKLSEETVRKILADATTSGRQLARKLGVNPCTVQRIRQGRKWSHLSRARAA